MRCIKFHSIACCAMACLIGFANDSEAQTVDINKSIFSKQNVKRLCEFDGKRLIVKREVLAKKLIDDAEVFDDLTQQNDFLRRAAPGGQATIGDPTPENITYFVSSPMPLGINHTYTEDEKVVQYRQRQILISLKQWLGGQLPNEDYFLTGGTPPTPERYFQKNSVYEIECKGRLPGAAPGKGSGQSKSAQQVLTNVIVRKSVADITVSGNDLKKAHGAQFSYADDEEKNKKSMSVEGLVGYLIAGTGEDRVQELAKKAKGASDADPTRSLYWYKVVPYLYYKDTTQSPASKANQDIRYISPGITTNLTYVNAPGTFSFVLQAEGSATFDEAQDADFYNLGLRFSPSFYINDQVLLGAPLEFGPFAVRPDLALVAREYIIGSAGSNPELQKQSSYSSLGYDGVIQMFLSDTDSVLSNFLAKAGYSYRHNDNGIKDVHRYSAGLSYVVNTNFTVDLDYVDGPDVNTLQEEQKWTAGLSFRN